MSIKRINELLDAFKANEHTKFKNLLEHADFINSFKSKGYSLDDITAATGIQGMHGQIEPHNVGYLTCYTYLNKYGTLEGENRAIKFEKISLGKDFSKRKSESLVNQLNAVVINMSVANELNLDINNNVRLLELEDLIDVKFCMHAAYPNNSDPSETHANIKYGSLKGIERNGSKVWFYAKTGELFLRPSMYNTKLHLMYDDSESLLHWSPIIGQNINMIDPYDNNTFDLNLSFIEDLDFERLEHSRKVKLAKLFCDIHKLDFKISTFETLSALYLSKNEIFELIKAQNMPDYNESLPLPIEI